MQIKDVMSNNCNWVAPETTLAEAAQIMKDQDIGFLAVGESDRLIGAVTDRDIAIRAVAGNVEANSQIRDIMTQKVMYCFEDQNVDEICNNMSDIKVRRLPVVNRDKRLVGTVSLGDLSQGQAQESGQALKNITNHSAQQAA